MERSAAAAAGRRAQAQVQRRRVARRRRGCRGGCRGGCRRGDTAGSGRREDLLRDARVRLRRPRRDGSAANRAGRRPRLRRRDGIERGVRGRHRDGLAGATSQRRGRARRRRLESIPGRELSSRFWDDHVRARGVGEASQAGLDRRGGKENASPRKVNIASLMPPVPGTVTDRYGTSRSSRDSLDPATRGKRQSGAQLCGAVALSPCGEFLAIAESQFIVRADGDDDAEGRTGADAARAWFASSRDGTSEAPTARGSTIATWCSRWTARFGRRDHG